MQVLNGVVAGTAEQGDIVISAAVNVDGDGMTITIECSTPRTGRGSWLCNTDVGSEGSIHPIRIIGICNHVTERIPVGAVADDEHTVVHGREAVRYRHCTSIVLACPRLALVVLGIDSRRGKEAVLYCSLTFLINPAD